MSKKLILSPSRDPFNITPGREKNAQWCVGNFNQYIIPFLEKEKITQIHIRDIHYILQGLEPSLIKPTGDLYINDTKSWNFLVDSIRDARYLNLLDYNKIRDNKNKIVINIRKDDHKDLDYRIRWLTNDLYDIKNSFITRSQFRFKDLFNLAKQQPFYIEVWTEKTLPILEQITEKYKIITNIVIGEGEISLTQVKKLVNRVLDYNKPIRIGYIGDMDVVGLNLAKSFTRKLEFFCRKHPELDIKVTRLMLLPDQVKKLNLPLKPMKISKNKGYETRKKNFYEKYDLNGAVEVNTLHSLHSDYFRKILENFIKTFYDPEIQEQYENYEKIMLKYIKNKLKSELPDFEGINIDLEELKFLYNPQKIKSGFSQDYSTFNWLFDSQRSIEEQFDYYNKN